MFFFSSFFFGFFFLHFRIERKFLSINGGKNRKIFAFFKFILFFVFKNYTATFICTSWIIIIFCFSFIFVVDYTEYLNSLLSVYWWNKRVCTALNLAFFFNFTFYYKTFKKMKIFWLNHLGIILGFQNRRSYVNCSQVTGNCPDTIYVHISDD